MLSNGLESMVVGRVTQDKEIDGDAIDVALLLRAAVEGVGCPHQVAAGRVGYQPDYWNRALNNDRGVVLGRLGRLPVDVQREFVTSWAEALGMTLERRAARSDELAQLGALLAEKRVKITLERL